MNIAWNSLLVVFVVAFGAAVAVVVLVSLALIGLSAADAAREGDATTPMLFSPATGRAVAGICLAAASAIVVYGLWIIIAA